MRPPTNLVNPTRSTPQPVALERRGRAWLVWSFILCPCHLPWTLAILTSVFAGTSAGVILRDHIWVAGTLVTVADTGHAVGIKNDDGVEVLVHVGIDTVQMEGKGFKLDVSKDMRVEEGDLLATVDLDAVKEAGFDPTTIVVVIITATLKSVAPVGAGDVGRGDTIIDVEV